jgi:hypothetical protein
VQFSKALDRMESLLEEERSAIRNIDVDSVVALADEKATLMDLMHASDWKNHRHEHARFRSMVARLRENGVLLAHARNCVRDALDVVAMSTATTYRVAGAPPSVAPARRLSVSG